MCNHSHKNYKYLKVSLIIYLRLDSGGIALILEGSQEGDSVSSEGLHQVVLLIFGEASFEGLVHDEG